MMLRYTVHGIIYPFCSGHHHELCLGNYIASISASASISISASALSYISSDIFAHVYDLTVDGISPDKIMENPLVYIHYISWLQCIIILLFLGLMDSLFLRYD